MINNRKSKKAPRTETMTIPYPGNRTMGAVAFMHDELPSGEVEPFKQNSQTSAPKSLVNIFSGQGKHVDEPFSSENVPGKQSVQLLLPEFIEKVPGGQNAHN